LLVALFHQYHLFAVGAERPLAAEHQIHVHNGSIADLKLFYTDHFTLPLPEGHRFPIEKYALLRQRVTEARIVGPEALCVPEPATDEELLRVHERGYLGRVVRGELTSKEIRRIGLPWSAALVERSRRSCGATIQACREALQDGMAVNLAGGTHHAFPDRGEGYCVFNDMAVAARAMQTEGLAQRIVILDCDVHQGNGNAAIFEGDPTVFTFSIHGEKNFPFHKEQSDLDIHLQDGAGDETYLTALEAGLKQALDKAGADLAIYIAGADPYGDDRYGRLSLSKAGLGERDEMVFRYCGDRRLPVAVTMGGGYARRIQDTVDIHFQTVAAAVQLVSPRSPRERGFQ
jgi:acetoin utilization deacetylase AcuC-like enzyme